MTCIQMQLPAAYLFPVASQIENYYDYFYATLSFLLSVSVTAADIHTLPDSIGSNPVLTRVEELKSSSVMER